MLRGGHGGLDALARVGVQSAAEHADLWNGSGDPETFARKNRVLDAWCAPVGRDPASIERTCWIHTPDELDLVDANLAAGATHVIYGLGTPFVLDPLIELLDRAAPDPRPENP